MVLWILASNASSVDPNDVVEQMIALQTAKAEDAFAELYGDGEGMDGEEPPERQAFIETYLTQALEQETRRVLREKGYEVDEPSRQGQSMLDVAKKDSPTTLEGEVERLSVQKRQRRGVRKRVRPGKALEEMVVADGGSRVWEIPCGEPLYRHHVYDAVPGCSPDPAHVPSCGRLVVDHFASAAESSEMVMAMDRSFEGLFHQGEETLLVPEADSRSRMGAAAFDLTVNLLERVRLSVSQLLNVTDLFYSGSLLKRMDFPPIDDAMQLDPSHNSSNPHVDKANIASYDWSALLYFTSVGQEFEGGELVFNDLDQDRSVRPLAGRLVAFSSGLENLHRVMPMKRGKRYVLSMWFTCSARHAHPHLGAGGSKAEHLGEHPRAEL